MLLGGGRPRLFLFPVCRVCETLLYAGLKGVCHSLENVNLEYMGGESVAVRRYPYHEYVGLSSTQWWSCFSFRKENCMFAVICSLLCLEGAHH